MFLNHQDFNHFLIDYCDCSDKILPSKVVVVVAVCTKLDLLIQDIKYDLDIINN